MHYFYKKIVLLIAAAITGTLVFFYIKNGAGDFESPKLIFYSAIGNVYVILTILIVIFSALNWINQAWHKSKRENIPFFDAFFIWKKERDEEIEKNRQAAVRDFPAELKFLGNPLKNGLFWLLVVIALGGIFLSGLILWGKHSLSL